MTCKQCLHYEVCVKLGKPSLYGINQEIGCSAYKDKIKWVEKKNGKWVKNYQNDNIVYCDQCYMPQDMPTPFCHSCGAEMVYEANVHTANYLS